MKRVLHVLAAGLMLAACNSTEQALTVDGVPVETPSNVKTVPTPPPSLTGASPTLSAVRMRFAPIIGAPVDKVTPLSRRLSARARASSVAIVASTDETATHVLKGYFSVLGEGSTTTVIYVFDVLDPAGARLHRIQGQETATGSNADDPWAAVPPALMETIADKAMSAFVAWGANPAA